MAENHDGDGGTCCRCCCRFIFTSGLTALFLWLSLRTYNPTLSIQDFYVPALNTTNNYNSTTNTNTNHSIYFDLKLQNRMNDKGVHYANTTLTFFYNSSTLPISNFTVPDFYQGHKKTARRKQTVEVVGLPWTAATAAVRSGSRVDFRIRLVTRVKFKILFWYTKRQSLVVRGDVAVNGSGRKDNKKKGIIKLKSGASNLVRNWVGPIIVSTLLMVLFL